HAGRNHRASERPSCAKRGRRPGFLERGRAFLAEYARRNRNADTGQLLAAIDQLQSIMVAQPTPHRTDPVKRQLRELLDEIGSAQCELDGTSPGNEDRGALADLIARVESRTSRILWSLRVADAAPEVETTPPPSEVFTTGRPIVVDHVVVR